MKRNTLFTLVLCALCAALTAAQDLQSEDGLTTVPAPATPATQLSTNATTNPPPKVAIASPPALLSNTNTIAADTPKPTPSFADGVVLGAYLGRRNPDVQPIDLILLANRMWLNANANATVK